MKKNLSFIFTILFCACFLTSCEKQSFQSSRTDFIFDTVVSVTFYSNNEKAAETAVSDCFNRLAELERIFSPTDANSELYALNVSASEQPVKVSDELFDCIEKTTEYCRAINGSLDISIGGIIALWGIGSDHAAVPEQADIDALLGVSYNNIILDKENQTIKFTDNRVKINLGAVAKGYAADELIEIADKYEVYGIIDLGGSITVVGADPDDNFTVGITDPADNGQLIGTVELSDRTASTSGDYQRYFIENDKQYHHILDINTGYPAESDISGVTIICIEPLLADFMSTTVFVMGSEKGLELVNSIDGAEAVIVRTNGEVILSDNVGNYNFTPYH